MSRYGCVAVFRSFLLSLILSIPLAQDPAAGIQPFSTQINGAYDAIDMATNNTFLAIPVRIKDGKIPFSFKLVMNEHAYQTRDVLLRTLNWNMAFPHLGGQLMGVGPTVGLPPLTLCNSRVDPSMAAYLIVFDATGAAHRTNNLSTAIDLYGYCPTRPNVVPQTVTTTDGSGYTVILTGVDTNAGEIQTTIYDKSGNTFPGLDGTLQQFPKRS